MGKTGFQILLFLIMLSNLAFAGDAPWHGVWKGSIGGQQVMVCLDDPESSSYYYRRHSDDISLSAKDKTGTRWAETSKGKKTGEWKLDLIGRNRLAGNWFAPKGKRSAPIALERVNTPSGNELCDSDAYNSPRIETAKIVTGKLEHFEGKRFHTISALEVSTIEIVEVGPQTTAVNQALRAKLRKEIANYFRCFESLNTREEGFGDYSVSETPVFWTSRWLTLAESAETDCGGAHPNHGYFYTTWDLKLGKVADLWTWFDGGEKEASAPLNKVIIAHSQRNDECAETIVENRYYSLHPAKDGMVFYPQLSHADIGCQDDIVVPYSKLLPFLTATGRTEVKALMRTVRHESNE